MTKFTKEQVIEASIQPMTTHAAIESAASGYGKYEEIMAHYRKEAEDEYQQLGQVQFMKNYMLTPRMVQNFIATGDTHRPLQHGTDGIQSRDATIKLQDEEIERLTEKCDKFKWQVRDTCQRAEKAETERDAAVKDAERYRGARATGCFFWSTDRMTADEVDASVDLKIAVWKKDPSQFDFADAAIDAARKP